jgi:hypothetical protein
MSLFATDPKGSSPFEYFCEAIVGFANLWHVRWDEKYGGTPNTVHLDDGTTLKMSVPFPKVMSNLENELQRLHNVAFEVTPLEVVQSACARYYNNVAKFIKEENYQQLTYNYFLFETALYFWKHNDKRVEDETYDYLINEYDSFIQLYEKWSEAAKMSGAPIDMPKTYDMGASLTQKALTAAKKQFSNFTVDKVVFTGNQWKEFKQQEWPYRVMHRSVDAALLTKVGDKWVIRFYSFLQKSDQKGGWIEDYGFQAGGNADPQPVNYKP